MKRHEPDSPAGRVVHCKRERYDVYIGRPSKWGNPFLMDRGEKFPGTREEVIAKFEAYLRSNTKLLKQLPELRGKVLGCWCAPLPCHGDVLLKLLAETNTPREAVKAHGGSTDAGAHGLPTPPSFEGLEKREEVIAKPLTYTEAANGK